MAPVAIREVRKSFGTVEVIHGVNVDITDGEFVILVGPSGCGKSTLLRMIAGLEDITSGTISVSGRVVNDLPPKERDIAMVFQSYALYPHMSVADNMAFSLRLAGVGKEQRYQKVREAAKVLQLEPLLDRKPRALSGGQRQRVAIGRAIVRNPKVFLFDEPLSNLDASLRVQMRIELARLHEELKATMIYVTHDQIEAMTLADQIVVLDSGIVRQAGTPLELYHHPNNVFVAGFIGSPKMNLLQTKVVSADAGGVGVTLPGGSTVTLPVRSGQVAVGDPVTFGIRPEHLRPSEGGAIAGEVLVAERLGGETYLYVQIAPGEIIVVQADGENPTRVHERVAVQVNAANCHLFDQSGAAVPRLQRHPLADMKRPTAKAS
jgi:multiple sugar transport system ATP-binding protein